jgi:hypothetical protein
LRQRQLDSQEPCAAGHACQYFALVKRQGRTIAVPLEYTFAFKRDRSVAATIEDVDVALKKREEQEKASGKILRERYRFDDAAGDAQGETLL